jgi:hypothetical protein
MGRIKELFITAEEAGYNIEMTTLSEMLEISEKGKIQDEERDWICRADVGEVSGEDYERLVAFGPRVHKEFLMANA